jgi:alpha-tubulin suppressor-like RCC1 family protein
MKLVPPDQRRAISAVRLSLTLAVMVMVPLLLCAAPAWWSQRNVLVQNAQPEDYAPANQGQLKNIARAAAAEMDAQLIGGAGDEIRGLLTSWNSVRPETNDFAPVNLGQLKSVAKPFYDRLITSGVIDTYPWLISVNDADDFAVASIGQVKNLFGFEIPAPNPVQLPGANRITAGQFSACLALESNATWLWRDQSGNAGQLSPDYPHRITGLPSVASVSAGERYLAVLAADGTVWTWGDNAIGQLGDGTNINRSIPAAVPNLVDIISLEAGGSHALALQSDGHVMAWGDNSYGQLGTGDTTSSSMPKVIPTLPKVRRIAAGFLRSAALTKDGTVWTWGYQYYNNQDVFTINPIAVPELSDVVDIAAGYEHVVAVKADGTVWAWGSNYANQIANGNPWWKFQDVPFQVPNLPPIAKVASKYDHTLAIATDGTVWSWGYNFDGQLGDGTTDARQIPVKVIGLTDVIAIATANTYSLAMKSDGTVWAWGDGATGILPGSDRHVPQQVGLGLLDSNHNGVDDRWEMHNFGNLTQSPDADFDGDGISNLKEYLRGTDPKDYYNGIPPLIEVAGGNNQVGDPGTFLTKPFKVRVRNAQGQALVNAPVTFSLTSEGGGLSTAMGGVLQQTVSVRTDLNGEAYIYHSLPNIGGISSRTVVTAGDSVPLASTSFRGVTRLTPPPQPTPTPDLKATPTPMPSPSGTPSATPIAPYRYAIIDLGKDVYPKRINNNGWILCDGPGPNDNWGSFRWKAGRSEFLEPSPTNNSFSTVDINDEGTVVGSEDGPYYKYSHWINGINELSAGLAWPANMTRPTKLSGPIEPSWHQNLPGSIRQAFFSAITNRNAVTNQTAYYGSSYLGEGAYRWLGLFDYHQVLNAQRWMDGTGAPIALSFSYSIVEDTWDPFFTVDWRGPMDRVTRANAAGHYIGSRITPNPPNVFPPGDTSGMIDGQSVSFDPVDINENDIVVGSKASGMIIRASDGNELAFPDSVPVAINDHTHPAPFPTPPASPTATPQPTPIPAPQVLSWTGNALALWELQSDGKTWHPFGLDEMIPSMDGWDDLNPSDMNDNGLIVGTARRTDPSNPTARAELHGFMLVPAEIVPDYNRDGKIDDNDRGKITESDPWRWWINDDDDTGDTGGTDIPGEREHPNFSTVPSPNGSDTGTIDGTRDLIDFFPLYLNISELVKLFPADGPTSYTYNLKQKGGSVNFAYTDLTPANALDYLRKLTGTGANNALALGGMPQTDGAVTHRITSEGVALDPQWIKKIASQPYGILLIEGRKAAENQIVLEIYSSASHRVTQVQLPLSLSSVEEMYRHKNLMGADNATGGLADYATGDDTAHSEPENYPDNLCSNKYLVFVHGYNVNPNDSRGWNAEMFKRLHQSGSKAKFVGITWNGAETQIPGMEVTVNYHKNVDHAFQTAKGTDSSIGFARFVKSLGAEVVIAAHSLGNVVVASAICDWQTDVSRFFMIDAAVSSEVLESLSGPIVRKQSMIHPEWLNYPHLVYATDWYKLFKQGDARRDLTWRGRFETLGRNAFNFYSSGEEVLAEHATALGDPSILDIAYTRDGFYVGKYAWALQEKLKGRIRELQSFPLLGSVYGGWAFTHNIGHPPHTPSATEVATLADSTFQTQPIFDPGFDLIEHSPSAGEPSGYVSVEPHGPDWVIDLVDQTKGSAVAANHRNTLLAEMFPATTLPIGSTFQESLGQEKNFDMQTQFKEGWPAERQNEDWRHSDLKNIAYPFIFHVFDSFVELGKLNP